MLQNILLFGAILLLSVIMLILVWELVFLLRNKDTFYRAKDYEGPRYMPKEVLQVYHTFLAHMRYISLMVAVALVLMVVQKMLAGADMFMLGGLSVVIAIFVVMTLAFTVKYRQIHAAVVERGGM